MGAGTLTAIATVDTSSFTLPLSFLPHTESGSSDQLEARQDLQYLPVLHCSLTGCVLLPASVYVCAGHTSF